MTILAALVFPFALSGCALIGIVGAMILGAFLGGDRPREIKARHLARFAVDYVRQSTDEQVQNNTGSTDYQREQVRHARAWGWPEELIVVNDLDLGLSGAAAGHRPGYLQLVADIEKDLVGAVFLADMSRGGRDAEEWFRLLRLCQLHDTLIVIDGRVYDPNDSAALLWARLQATLAEHDNITRREILQRGRLQKAIKGLPVSAPPRGYVRNADGTWSKDPDVAVQAAIEKTLRTFLRERSCSRLLLALQREGVKLPRRRRARLDWIEPSVTTLYWLLKNPAYAGIYRYRKTITDPRAGRDPRGHLRCRRAEPDEIVWVPNNHEPYISGAEWQEIQTILSLNGPSEFRRNLGPGTALVQGIIRCEMHRLHAMITVYKAERRIGGRSHAYNCLGDYHHGGPQCGRIPGRHVDEAVTTAILGRLAPPRLETLRAAMQEVTAGERSDRFRRKLERNRLRHEVTVYEEKFFSLDPTSTETAKAAERRLEDAKRALKAVERLLDEEAAPAVAFGDEAMGELIALCADLHSLWNAPTTTALDRKQIARILIERVVLEYRDAERVRLRIDWADAGPPTTVTFTLPEHTNVLIEEMRATGLLVQQIADRLNELGVPTQSGNRWERAVVAKKVARLDARRERRQQGDGRRRGRRQE